MAGRELGTTLRQWRLGARLTQRDPALRIGFHESAVASIKRGERAPSAQYLDGVASALRLEVDRRDRMWLLYRVDPDEQGADEERNAVPESVGVAAARPAEPRRRSPGPAARRDPDRADLRDADLSGTDLSGARLAGALLEGARLDGAQWDAATEWPGGFVPPEPDSDPDAASRLK